MSDLIQKEDTLVILTREGSIKRITQNEYKLQSRGGKGVSSINLEREDNILTNLAANTHDILFFATSLGKIYTLHVFEIKDTHRSTRGVSLKDLFNLSSGESVVAMAKSSSFESEEYLLFTTAMGKVAKIDIGEFKSAKSKGIIAFRPSENDFITSLSSIKKSDMLVFVTSNGNSLQFDEEQIRLTKRGTQGVIAMKLKGDNILVKALSSTNREFLVMVLENGYAKKLKLSEISTLKRGASGVICYKTNSKTGKIKDIDTINSNDELFLISSSGKTLKVSEASISPQGRFARGVQAMSLGSDSLVSISRAI